MSFPSSSYDSSKYEQQLGVILNQELKIEDLQAKLINNGGSYAAMIKNEETVKLKFVNLMQTKYPELQGLSPDAVVAMINQFPEILSLQSQLATVLGDYATIGELQDALEMANSAVTVAEGQLEAIRANLKDKEQKLEEAIASGASLSVIDQLKATINSLAAAEAIAEGALINLRASAAALLERYDQAVLLDTQIKALTAGNVVWELYPSLSTTEQELITLFTN